MGFSPRGVCYQRCYRSFEFKSLRYEILHYWPIKCWFNQCHRHPRSAHNNLLWLLSGHLLWFPWRAINPTIHCGVMPQNYDTLRTRWRYQKEVISALPVLCVGNSPDNISQKGSVTRTITFRWCGSTQTVKQTVDWPVICGFMTFMWRHRNETRRSDYFEFESLTALDGFLNKNVKKHRTIICLWLNMLSFWHATISSI